MLTLLYLVPLLPLAAALILGLGAARLPRPAIAVLGCAGAAASFLLTAAAAVQSWPAIDTGVTQTLYTWLAVDGFRPAVAFTLDPLSAVMCLVVTFVGTLILIYSTVFMAAEDGYARFFAYMNLFVGSMLILVLAENLLLLYLGWEGVGLCSYLLIGFWYRDRANARAAYKAFLVTRIGDTALALGLFLIFLQTGSLSIPAVLQQAPLHWGVGSAMATAAAALLLGGAVGKSAQLPLQTWLPDAMAGPTPVSALIHAATMVTAGVYLIARLHGLFALAPLVQWLVAVIGAATLLLAACSALTQYDAKRVLAYSTMSQIGYMFLGLGVGAWTAAIFHLFTHAFFKSLLFLAIGVVIQNLDEEHDIRRMGGLRRDLPLVFWTFLIGAASLSAVPWVTAGFFSKDAILTGAWAAGQGGLWWLGLAGAVLTSLYSFRLVFMVFFGERKKEPLQREPAPMTVPLVVLATLAVLAGYVSLGSGEAGYFGSLLRPSLAAASPPSPAPSPSAATGLLLAQLAAAAASLLGVGAAALLYLRRPAVLREAAARPAARALASYWRGGWGFDALYGALLVRPYVYAARLNRGDFLDYAFRGLADLALALHGLLSLTQTGRVRAYAAAVVVGAVLLLAAVVLR